MKYQPHDKSLLVQFDEHGCMEIADRALLDWVGGGDLVNIGCAGTSNGDCINVNNACGSDLGCGTVIVGGDPILHGGAPTNPYCPPNQGCPSNRVCLC